MFVSYHGLEIVANDYNANSARGPLQTNATHDRFEAPFVKPVFLILNCVSNSTQQQLHQLLVNDGAGDGDFLTAVVRWRGFIDSVQAPLPQIINTRRENSLIRFNFLGQRGRTNQVQSSSNLINWAVVTNVTGTNTSILFREPAAQPNRAYRIRRL